MTTPAFEAYTAAMLEHGNHNITVEMNVLQLTMLIGSLQPALRHPHYPAHMRPYVEAFIEEAIRTMATRSPVIAEVMQAGNDPQQDT